MTGKPIINIAASIRQRLLNAARERGEPFDFVLTMYGNERFIEKGGQSGEKNLEGMIEELRDRSSLFVIRSSG